MARGRDEWRGKSSFLRASYETTEGEKKFPRAMLEWFNEDWKFSVIAFGDLFINRNKSFGEIFFNKISSVGDLRRKLFYVIKTC